MTLKSFEFLTYLCCGVICLVLGVVLLGVKYDYSENSREGFRPVKNFVAYATFMEVFLYAVVILLQNFHTDFLLVNYFLAPLIFFFQVFLCASSMLMLMRYPQVTLRNQILFVIPVAVLALAHYGGFFMAHGFVFDVDMYDSYVHTVYSSVLHCLLNAVIVVELGCLGVWLVKACRNYNSMIENWYSGNEQVRNRKLTSILYGFFLYFVLSEINLLWFSELASAVITWIVTILFMVFVISLINLQRLFSIVSPAFTYRQELLSEDLKKDGGSREEPEENRRTMSCEKSASIDEIVRTWSASPHKYFLQEGITLGITASQMGISQRLLSDFLNTVYDMNFNSWINGLRIQEIRRHLEEGTRLQMGELAQMAGFADASAMSKAFKKITGVTPTQYKAGIRSDSAS